MSLMRLDRLLSQATALSRKQAIACIKKGEVSLDGEVLVNASLRIEACSLLLWRGIETSLSEPLYIMLHKPLGVVCAKSDARHDTVMNLLPETLASKVHIVGRLDKDTTGLLLLTDDGDWSHRITSPRNLCEKRYRTELAETLTDEAEKRLAEGVVLRNDKPSFPSSLMRHSSKEVSLTVTEGRYHLVRRIFAALNNHVNTLHRESIGRLELDPLLKSGEWRYLTAIEITLVFEK